MLVVSCWDAPRLPPPGVFTQDPPKHRFDAGAQCAPGVAADAVPALSVIMAAATAADSTVICVGFIGFSFA